MVKCLRDILCDISQRGSSYEGVAYQLSPTVSWKMEIPRTYDFIRNAGSIVIPEFKSPGQCPSGIKRVIVRSSTEIFTSIWQ